ncbi:MAG: DNA translocase FtsK [Dysgonamonadaceae bacterium]|jgi:S-DNA-T family DNA segregation ATPase FtsK/SpoIIIE|nr:DNA translocase FtsK [Dysgonamonadaceae bacterium]
MLKKKNSAKQQKAASEAGSLKRFLSSSTTQFTFGLIILIFSVYAVIAFISFFFSGAADQSRIEGVSLFHWGRIEGVENWAGTRGALLANLLVNQWFGISSAFILIFLITLSLRLMQVKYIKLLKSFILCTVFTIWLSLALSFCLQPLFNETAFLVGGKHGQALSSLLKNNIGTPGTLLLIILLFIIIMIFLSSQTIPFIRNLFTLRFNNWKIKPKKGETKTETNSEENDDENEVIVVPDDDDKPEIKKEPLKSPTMNADDDFEINIGNDESESLIPIPEKKPETAPLSPFEADKNAEQLLAELGPYDPQADLSHYQYPTLDLLKEYNQGGIQVDKDEQLANRDKIIATLGSFGINIKSIKATVGPTVTLYEIVPGEGVRIGKIKNLEDDIALNLSALGIRIIAPMPGKGTIGIEVPNKEPQIVPMQSILASKKYQETKFELPIAFGRTITNEVFMVDLIKMPHLLVAGATGQGKSVGLNAAITSLLYKKHPSELKFVLIDPKMVEFSLYSVIEKHFLAKLPDAEKPIITDYTKVIYTLNSLCIEMDDRYKLLEDSGSRNVQEYNEKFINRRLNPNKGHRFMPYIVVIIDEYGDLIMTAGKEIEQPIARIAQKARAVGIHMIIATQRPTTNIITGTIKANFPARIAFRVIAAVDSRTILDATGANQLVGRGDMLFFQGSDMTRIQCAFVDTPEVERITRFIGNQQGYTEALMLPEYTGEVSDELSPDVSLDKLDPMFADAARLIVSTQSGSTSSIQRKFGIGYNRAGRIMDMMELAGIVGPTRGSKPRDVLIIDEYSLEHKFKELGI